MQRYVSMHSIHLGLVTPMMCLGKAKIDLCVWFFPFSLLHFHSPLHPPINTPSFPHGTPPYLTFTPHNWHPTSAHQEFPIPRFVGKHWNPTIFGLTVPHKLPWVSLLIAKTLSAIYVLYWTCFSLSPQDATYLAWKLAFSTGDWPTLVSQVSHPIEITLHQLDQVSVWWKHLNWGEELM